MINLNDLMNQMTIDEKIGQLTQYNANLFLDSDADVTGPLTYIGLTKENLKTVGSVLNFNNASEACKIQRKHLEQDRNKIPMTFMMDVIHGYRTIYPIPLALGCSFNTDMVKECTKMAAREASASGVQVTFSPMVDCVRDARWGRVLESCGEEPMINSLMGKAQIEAFRGDSLADWNNLATCVKHFAAYGGAESGRDYNIVELSEHTLRQYYLPSYKACLDAGADMIMPAFNVLNGIPCIANNWLMKKILKEEWNSDAIVISDYNAVGELLNHGICANMKDAARLAFENGCNIEMCSGGYINNLKTLIEEGVITEQQLDEAVMKVLELKQKLGLFEDPYHGASPEREETECLTDENRVIARKSANECAVLLKNEGVLPFSENLRKIALIGPFADEHAINGLWHCQGRDNETITVKQGIENIIPYAQVIVAKGCSSNWNDFNQSYFDEAIEAAKTADAVILCLGEPQDYSAEGNCRTDIDLPGLQNKLAQKIVSVNKNTVAVVFMGRPLSIKKLSQTVPAILNMWFPGTEGGNAVADLLFGKVNPSGKLTISFPQAVGQCPIYYNRLNTGRPKSSQSDDERTIYESSYVDCGNLPLYSFGYGLSYSEFVYEEMKLSQKEFSRDEKVTVNVTVYNNSDRDGKEVVMLYMRDLVASCSRPVQQLIAFKKIEFKARERKIIEFSLDEAMFKFWNNENQFVSEAGEFQISTGYADHLLYTTSLFLKD